MKNKTITILKIVFLSIVTLLITFYLIYLLLNKGLLLIENFINSESSIGLFIVSLLLSTIALIISYILSKKVGEFLHLNNRTINITVLAITILFVSFFILQLYLGLKGINLSSGGGIPTLE